MKRLNLSKIQLLMIGVISISVISMSMKNSISVNFKILNKPTMISKHLIPINTTVSEELKALGIKIMATDSTTINDLNNTVKLYGEAELSNKKIDVKAGFIEVNLNSKTGVAKGNVSYYDINKKTTTNSDQMSFNL
jgi:lipopolysaccharide assembly outer membrane protein LptD (OstA)